MSSSSKHTGKEAASAASKTLTGGRTSADSKTAGASALSQADQSVDKNAGEAATQAASNVLQSDETGDKSKTAAASALLQKKGSGD